MSHLLKITFYLKSTCICFVQGHIENRSKVSKYYISACLPFYSSSSIVYCVSLWELWYELRPQWTKCCGPMPERVAMRDSFGIYVHSQNMSSWPVDAKSTTTCFLNSYTSSSTSRKQWLQQLHRVDSSLALNSISNLLSNKWIISSNTILLISCLSHPYSYLICVIFQ